MPEHLIHNPIIPGNFPDPSICRVGDDFYLACSSFEDYPGIPIFHSRDLANWELLGHAMTLDNGFVVDTTQQGGGVMAPTIRYHDGTFYIINANYCHKGNYIVTATNPAGPWSEPHFLPDVPEIDASIFFDDDGKCYVVGTGYITNPDGKRERGIWAQEFDIQNFHVVGERHEIWNCALRNAADPEAPHIFHVGEYYYLIIAEGGTDFYHAVTVARARNIFDWYEGNRANPILTHRHLGRSYPVTNIGHADFVELPDGSWWAVMLGSRSYDGYRPFGRETFICPMVWEQGWPVLAPGTGKVENTYPAPQSLPWTPFPEEPALDDFDGETLRSRWIFAGAPYQDFWRLENSSLYLKCLPRPMDRMPAPVKKLAQEEKEPVRDDCISLVMQHQTTLDFSATTKLRFAPREEETAGLFVGSSLRSHLRIEMFQYDGVQYLSCRGFSVRSSSMWYDRQVLAKVTLEEYARVPWPDGEVVLRLISRDRKYSFLYGPDEAHLTPLCEGVAPDGFRGGIIFGLFASANGGQSGNEAAFDWFRCEE